MSYTYSLNVIRRREVNGRISASGISRQFASTRSTAEDICAALGFTDELQFVSDGGEITSVVLDRDRFLACSIHDAKQSINGVAVGSEVDLSGEFTRLIQAKADLAADAMGRVFLEFN